MGITPVQKDITLQSAIIKDGKNNTPQLKERLLLATYCYAMLFKQGQSMRCEHNTRQCSLKVTPNSFYTVSLVL